MVIEFCTWVCGPRFKHHYDKHGECILTTYSDGAVCVTKLGPVVALMIGADFMLEVDVALSKIELIPNGYIVFFLLYFIAPDLFRRFPPMKYSVSLVFVYFGVEMLVSQYFRLMRCFLAPWCLQYLLVLL